MRIILLPLLVRFCLIYRIRSYWELSYFFIDEIWFDLQDMGFSGCPCYWPLGRTNWAPVVGPCQGPWRFTELTYFLGLVSGPARLFFKPYQLPPSPWLRRAWARVVSFLELGATSTWTFRVGLVKALSPSTVL